MLTASLCVVGHECRTPLQNLEVLHLFKFFSHTHTRPAAAGLFQAQRNEMKVKMKGTWTGDDGGHEMTAT